MKPQITDFKGCSQRQNLVETKLPGGHQIYAYSTLNTQSDPKYSHPFEDRMLALSGNIGNQDEKKQFLLETAKKIHEETKQDKDFDYAGAATCQLIYDKKSKEITVGNLGDCKAYAIIKSKNKLILVGLSENFRAGTPRFSEHIKKNGGKLIEPHPGYFRIDGGPAMAGEFGDNNMGDILVRVPDVYTLTLEEIISAIKTIDPAELKDEKFELSSLFVASDGFNDYEMSFLKDKERYKNRLFDALYNFELTESGQKNFYRLSRDTSNPQIVDIISSEAHKEMDYKDNLGSAKMQIDRMTARVDDEELCQPVHLVSLARIHGSSDDISIMQCKIDNNEIIEGENSQVFLGMVDAHAKKQMDVKKQYITTQNGVRIAKIVADEYEKAFVAKCEEVKKQQPGASPADAEAAAAEMKGLSIQPDA